MKFKFVLIFLFVIATGRSFAQQDPLFSQYLFNPMVYNPAYAGIYNMGSGTIESRIQKISGGFASFTNVMSASSSFPSTETMGLGINIINDRVGIDNGHTDVNHTEINLIYSYKLELGDLTYLSAGLQADIANDRLDNNGLTLRFENDPLVTPGVTSKTKMNFGTGLFLLNEEKYFVSFAIPRILNSSISVNDYLLQSYKRTFYLSGGAILNKEGSIPVRPAFIVRSVQGAPASVDVSASVLLSDVIWAGVSVRNGKTLAIIGQLDINEYIRIGYSTDLPLSNVVFKNLGTHEFSVNINFAAFKDQLVVYPRYF